MRRNPRRPCAGRGPRPARSVPRACFRAAHVEEVLVRVATGTSTARDAALLRKLLSINTGFPIANHLAEHQEIYMDSSSSGSAVPAPEGEPLIAILCKAVIKAAHETGSAGLAEADAYPVFGRRGVSRLQFELFIESMARAGLVVRGDKGVLCPTVRGLAYAGIRPPVTSRAPGATAA
jgi:hypothetical protein